MDNNRKIKGAMTDDAVALKAKFSSKMQKRVPPLVDGDLVVEGLHGKTKLLVIHEGRSFWAYVDPVDLVLAAMQAVPVVRAGEVAHADTFDTFCRLLVDKDE